MLIEPLLLALLAPFALFPTPVSAVALLVIPALWVYQWRHTGHFLPPTPLDWPILILGLMLLVSLWATYDLSISLPKIAGLVYGIGLYYGWVRATEKPRGWLLGLAVFLLAGVAIALISLLGSRWADKLPGLAVALSQLPIVITGLPGAEAGFNPNEVAGALLWVIPPLGIAALLLVRESARIRQRIGIWGWLALTLGIGFATLGVLAAFGLTQSRSGYLGLALTLPVLLLAALPPRPRLVFLAGGVILVTLVIGSLTLNSGQAGFHQGWGLFLSSLGSRPEIWSRAVYALQDFPFTGMGMNTFRHLVHVLYPMLEVGPEIDIGHAHNELLQAGLDLGLPGLIAFLAVNLMALWMLYKIEKYPLAFAAQGWAPALRLMILGLGGGWLAHSLYGLTDAISLGAKPGFLFWMLLGLIASLYRQHSLTMLNISKG